VERIVRIELTFSGWKPEALPLSYTRRSWSYGDRTRLNLGHNQVPSPAGSRPHKLENVFSRAADGSRTHVCVLTMHVPRLQGPSGTWLNVLLVGGMTRTRTGIFGLQHRGLPIGRSPHCLLIALQVGKDSNPDK
jgi:hypothetical protein